jgi:hypothetical protein
MPQNPGSGPKTQGLDDEENMAADEENMASHPYRPPVRPLENARAIRAERICQLVREASGRLVRSQPSGHQVEATIIARRRLEVRRERRGAARTTSYLNVWS